MKREERKEEKKPLKEWKKPELKVLDKRGTEGGNSPDFTEAFTALGQS